MFKDLIDSFLRFLSRFYEGMIIIFMLHRVSPLDPSKLFPNENMKISPEFLEKFIVELRSKGYEFITLDRVYEILANRERVRRQIAFTLDDGYLDNYTIAYPIFKKYDVPFTIYITTSFPENKAILWWYVLEDLILENDIIRLNNGFVFRCKTKEEKGDVFMQIRRIILDSGKFGGENFLEFLNELFCYYEIDWLAKSKEFCRELCMRWEHIVELAKDNLCTIGNHTKNHYPLRKLSDEEVRSEILDANRLLEEKIGKKVEHFAYPFGSKNEIGKRELDIVRSLGFKTATTTLHGTIYPEHRHYLNCLPRIFLTENFNIKNAYKIRKRRIVTL